MNVNCPTCGAEIYYHPLDEGKTIKCPNGHEFTIQLPRAQKRALEKRIAKHRTESEKKQRRREEREEKGKQKVAQTRKDSAYPANLLVFNAIFGSASILAVGLTFLVPLMSGRNQRGRNQRGGIKGGIKGRNQRGQTSLLSSETTTYP